MVRRIPAIAVDAEFGQAGVVSNVGSAVFKLSRPFLMFPEKTIGVLGRRAIGPTLLPASIE